MDAKFLVFDASGLAAKFSQLGPARQHAAELAADDVGTDYVVYERVIAYRGRVVVEDDAPKDGNEKAVSNV